jgi:SAM-dependent methyltransferase
LTTDVLNPSEIDVVGTVKISAADLTQRRYELPAPGASIKVLQVGDFEPAAAWLQAAGYRIGSCTRPSQVEAARYRLWQPTSLLSEKVAAMQPGRALDAGCGGGRNAVYLASLGWQVEAFDRLPEAIEKGRRLELLYSTGSAIKWSVTPADQWAHHGSDLTVASFFWNRLFYEQADRPFLAEIYADIRGAPTLEYLRKVFGHSAVTVLRGKRTRIRVFALE